jgi:molybdopterin synthase catalytic subunit/molybdopterin synthase sulfur carrier subunit
MAAAVKVLAFAGARDVIGASEIEVDIGAAEGSEFTVETLMDLLCERYPAMVPFRPIVRMAVNGSYAEAGQRVAPGDEVALIPPVAGG